MLRGHRHAGAARAVADVNAVLKERGGSLIATDHTWALDGPDTLVCHTATAAALKREVLEWYKAAVARDDLVGLSELTPLLWLLNMDELGVRLYLQYSGRCRTPST